MANNHFRSSSFPSACHPISAHFDEQLTRLISSSDTTTSCSSLTRSLTRLIDLYECFDDFLLRPSNQQVISKSSPTNFSSVDNMLDRSLRLLDVCAVAQDALLLIKDSLQWVQSVVRRRSTDDSNIRKGISGYLNNRKKVKKEIRQCLRSMKITESRVESVFGSVDSITSDVFMSLLSYIAGVKRQPKGNISLVGRLVRQVSNIDKVGRGNEFEDIDAQLRSLISQKKGVLKMAQLENVRAKMFNLESEIEELVEELECLFRHLVKTRTTLLNLLSN